MISFKDEEYLIECIEGICIALGSYPLNIDGNPSISENWREHILESRKLKNCRSVRVISLLVTLGQYSDRWSQ